MHPAPTAVNLPLCQNNLYYMHPAFNSFESAIVAFLATHCYMQSVSQVTDLSLIQYQCQNAVHYYYVIMQWNICQYNSMQCSNNVLILNMVYVISLHYEWIG